MLKKYLTFFLFSLSAFIQADLTPNQSYALLQLQIGNENQVLAELAALEPNAMEHTLNQISGEQFTALAVASEIAGTNFLRSLYNPVRLQVIFSPYPYSCCCGPSLEIWVQGGGGQSFINNCRHADNTIADHHCINLGTQASFNRNWTIGTAASFVRNKLDYRQDGNATNRFRFAGIYGLYRPVGYYVMADLIYGVGRGSLKRTINFNDFDHFSFSNPKRYQLLGYIEAGLDHILWNLLVQPFLGLEGHAIFNKRVEERGSSPFNLTVFNRNDGNVYSRLGAHITMDQCLFLVSLDLVWKYHLNPSHHKIFVHFHHFGHKFPVKDVKRGQSFFEGALAVTTNNLQGFDFFAEGSGIVGYHSASYQLLAGLQYAW